jgi:hypothetical protein
MTEVYERAKQIIVWHGGADEESDQAMTAIAAMHQSCSGNGNHLPSINELRSITSLRKREYWKRSWIIQELSTPRDAGKSTVIWCGEKRVSWEALRAVNAMVLPTSNGGPEWTARLLEFRSKVIFSAADIQRARECTAPEEKLHLLHLLDAIRDSMATDDKDKVYSVLGISKEGQQEELRPDYSQSTQQLYHLVATHILSHGGNLNLLARCDCSETTIPAELPSWAPRWNRSSINHLTPNTLTFYNASENRQRSLDILPCTKYLLVKGIDVGTISTTLSEEREAETSGNLALRWIKFIFEDVLAIEKRYVDGQSLRSAAESIICSDLRSADTAIKRALARGVRRRRPSQDILSKVSTELEDFNLIADDVVIRAFTVGRRLFRTENGYLGVGSKLVQAGDRVFVICGCSVPLLLRPDGDQF